MDSLTRHIGFLILALLVLFPTNAYSSAATDNEKQYRRISSMSERELYEKAVNFERKGDTDSMLIYYNVLFSRYDPKLNIGDRRLCAQALLSSANAYYDQFNYEKAMTLLLECRRIAELNGFSDILANVYRSIGNIYSTYSDFDRGQTFYERSFHLADSIGDNSLRLKAINNLIGVNSFKGRNKEAVKYYELLKTSPAEDDVYTYDLYMDGGLIEAIEGNVEAAAADYRKAASWAESHNLGIKYSGAAYSCLAGLYRQTEQIDSALYYHHINEQAARVHSQEDLLAETLRELSSLYASIGRTGKAQEYQTEYIRIWEQIFNQREFHNLKNAEFLYELDQSVGTINQLNKETREKDIQLTAQRKMLWTMLVTTLIVLALLFIIYSQKRKLSSAYKDLFARNTVNLENEKFYMKRIGELEDEIETLRTNLPASAEPEIAEADMPVLSPVALPDLLHKRLERAVMDTMARTEVICDPEFSVNRLAALVDSNSTYVSRVVNDMYGKNFRTVLNEARIKESMNRLADDSYSNFTIKAIAESVGYKSQSNFITVFTKFTGMKPSMYQQIARKSRQ